MQIACRGTYAPFLCTAGCIAEADKCCPDTFCADTECADTACAGAYSMVVPRRNSRYLYSADMACAVQVQSRGHMRGIPLDRFIGIKKAGFLRLSVGLSWLPRLTFRLRFTAPRGLVFAVIVTAVPAVVSAGVAVPAAGCVGTVVLRVILLWFPDHVNDEPDDQNDCGDNPDPYAG